MIGYLLLWFGLFTVLGIASNLTDEDGKTGARLVMKFLVAPIFIILIWVNTVSAWNGLWSPNEPAKPKPIKTAAVVPVKDKPSPTKIVVSSPTKAASNDSKCDPAYPGVCIPPLSVKGDLDCSDVQYTNFVVLPPDPHNFDGDGDGRGCTG